MRNATNAATGPGERSCPDCPLARAGRLEALVGGTRGCALRAYPLEARQPLPSTWGERHSVGIVRRGWVLRSRSDGRGHQTAVDLAGPGSLIPLRIRGEHAVPSGLAATRAIVCLVPDDVLGARSGDATLLRDLLDMKADALDRVERIADARGRETAGDKVAALIDALAEMRGPTHPRGVPDGLQQRDLAALLQIRPETVCRELRKVRLAPVEGVQGGVSPD